MISVIVPVYNESKNIEPLTREIDDVLKKLGEEYEIIFVEDGSRDDTFKELERMSRALPKLKALRFARNFGQTAAFAAGIEQSKGDVIFLMDGDLQNDPHDIPKLLSVLRSGYDVVSGWRKNRWSTNVFTRKIPSLVANALISKVSGVKLHDYGCMLKAYRREVLIDVPLYGEMHRFIPAYVSGQGARITEIPVNSRARIHGSSKYGLSRTFRVLLDLVFIKFMLKYSRRPIHFFGGLGFFSITLGFVSGLVAIVLKIYGTNFVRTPLPTLTAMFIIVGVQFIIMGVLSEVIMRTYYESQKKMPYRIKEKINV